MYPPPLLPPAVPNVNPIAGGEENGKENKDQVGRLSRSSDGAASTTSASSSSTSSSAGPADQVQVFTMEALAEATDGFSADKRIGVGQFGTVYSGKIGGRRVAIKRLHHENAYEAKLFQREITNLAACRHPNLLGFYGWAVDPVTGDRFLVTEFINGGSVTSRFGAEREAAAAQIAAAAAAVAPDAAAAAAPAQGKSADNIMTLPAGSRRFGTPLNLEQRIDVAAQVIEGLAVLHKATIVHRDLKADNILLREVPLAERASGVIAKVADFGLSRLSPELAAGKQAYSFVVGTPGYIDPAYQMTGTVDARSDVYSYGVLLVELLMGKTILSTKMNFVAVARSVLERKITLESIADPYILEQIRASEAHRVAAHELLRLACDCVQDSRGARPTLEVILARLTVMLANVNAAASVATRVLLPLAREAARELCPNPASLSLEDFAAEHYTPALALAMYRAVIASSRAAEQQPKSTSSLTSSSSAASLTVSFDALQAASKADKVFVEKAQRVTRRIMALKEATRRELELACRNHVKV